MIIPKIYLGSCNFSSFFFMAESYSIVYICHFLFILSSVHLHFVCYHVCCGEGTGTPLQYAGLRIPWLEEPGGLQSMESLRVGHD